LEALASGLAVVAYDYAAARQHIVHEKSGWLVPFGDAAAFTHAAKELAESPARMVNLKQNARAAADRLSWDNIASEFAKNLREAVDNHSAQLGSPKEAPVKGTSQPSLPPQSTSLPI
jgi:glycosyltransferase involved in cell wall biosynthesis